MESTRKGDWFVTYTGRRFYPFDARVEDVDLKDIAHSLALQTRWNGHCKTFYSIASHSLACAKVAEEYGASAADVMWCLMHDAAEAYIGDIISPIKRTLVVDFGDAMTAMTINEAEDHLLRIIARKFRIPEKMPPIAKEIDLRMLVTEALHLTNYARDDHWVTEKPWAHIKPYGDDHVLLMQSPTMAEATFLARAEEYLSLV